MAAQQILKNIKLNGMNKMAEDKKTHSYIFPNPLAKFMAKIDLRVQLEASMMSMSLMMIGLIISGFYISFYINFPLWYKIVLVINFVAGVVFMWSFIVTTFQQYLSYMNVVDYQNVERRLNENAKENRA